MSKNREKTHSNENAGKKDAPSSGHEPVPDTPGTDEPSGAKQTATGKHPAAEPVRQPKDDGQTPADAGHQASTGNKSAQPHYDSPEAKAAQLQDRLLRLQADFDNFRKRTLREKSAIYDNANQSLMLELLPVLDHLHLGLQSASEHKADPAFLEGMTLILDQLMGTLAKFGLSEIAAENKVFDPNFFEAITVQPSATEPEGKILSVVRRGYLLRDKLLRPAQVIVSAGAQPKKNAESGKQNAE